MVVSTSSNPDPTTNANANGIAIVDDVTTSLSAAVASVPSSSSSSLVSYYETIILEDLRQAVDAEGDGLKLKQILVKYENMKKRKYSSSEKEEKGDDAAAADDDDDAVLVAEAAAAAAAAAVDFEFEFQPSYLTDVLVKRLLVAPSSSSSSSNSTNSVSASASASASASSYLQVAQTLVQTNPFIYLPAIATSVSKLVKVQNNKNNITITADCLSIELLQLWIALIANPVCPVSSVHEKLSNSLFVLFQRRQSRDDANTDLLLVEQKLKWELLLNKMIEFLVNDNWKKYYDSNSIASIRCATFMIRCISHLDNNNDNNDNDGPDSSNVLTKIKSNGGFDLLLNMLNDFNDPLQQLSLLDCLIEEFDKSDDIDANDDANANANANANDDAVSAINDNNNNNKSNTSNSQHVMDWLSSPEMMSPILQYLKDPLLCDAALRYVGMLSTMKSKEINIVFDHIKSLGKVPTNEIERLPIIRALSQAATIASSSSSIAAESESENEDTPLDIILKDPILRSCWWDISRVSQSKLQAAVLISISLTLPKITAITSSSKVAKVTKLYKLIGSDNTNERETTLDWLLNKKFIKSSIIEIRIATYSLLASIFRCVPDACKMEFNIDQNVKESIIELLLMDRDRENTVNSQKAKYDLLESFMNNIMDEVVTDKKILKQFHDKISLGPHGRKSHRYEDIMIA
jgi:hypothetical protein